MQVMSICSASLVLSDDSAVKNLAPYGLSLIL